MGNPQTSTHAGLQKALYVLEVIKSLPAGDVIYKQVEHVLVDFQQHQSEIERAYHAVTYALLDAYLQHLQPGSPLAIQVNLLQRRLQPPVWSADLEAMRAQVDIYSSHIIAMQDFNQDKLTDSLALLLGDGSSQQQASTQKQRLHEQVMAPVDIQDEPSVSSADIIKAMPQDQEFGVVLDLLSNELEVLDNVDGIDDVRQHMRGLVDKLKDSHGDLVGNLQEAVEVLSQAEGSKTRLDEELQRVRMLSMTDELTELPNRRAFLDRLHDEVGRVKRHHVPLSLVLIDLDEFKHINDVHGHNAGDAVLRCYADEVFSLFRQYDMVARYGGEEFAVLLPNTDRDGALCALSKAMDRVKALNCHIEDSHAISVPSFSAGLAVYHEGEVTDSFIDRADQALYKAKSLGRNRVESDSL